MTETISDLNHEESLDIVVAELGTIIQPLKDDERFTRKGCTNWQWKESAFAQSKFALWDGLLHRCTCKMKWMPLICDFIAEINQQNLDGEPPLQIDETLINATCLCLHSYLYQLNARPILGHQPVFVPWLPFHPLCGSCGTYFKSLQQSSLQLVLR